VLRSWCVDLLGKRYNIDRILVHRSLAMAALRLVAIHGQAERGNTLEKREDYDALGNAAGDRDPDHDPDDANRQILPTLCSAFRA
jgi:hypothetical protein